MDAAVLMRIWRGSWVTFLLIAGFIGSYLILPLIYPFLFAWLIALMLNPLVNGMTDKLRIPRWLSVTLALTVFIAGMLTVAAAVVTRIIKEIITLSQTIQKYLEVWRSIFINLVDNEEVQSFIRTINSLYVDNPNIQDTINSNIKKTTETVTDTITYLVSSILNGIVLFLSSLPNIATISVVVLLAAFFISKDWKRWLIIASDLIPERVRKPIRTIWSDLKKALFGYLRAQFILITITAVVVITGLLIIQVEYAVTIGLLIGFVDLLPYLGVGAVMVPWIAYCFLTGSASTGVGLSILYGIVLVARQIIEPKVLASSVGLDPLATLIAMFIGLKMFGVLGIIIGPVSLVFISAIYRAHVFRDLRNYIMTGRR
ncbi:sporulation integral membrane protein YtvI [Paenibacillus taiwanensis]|uniref:sporulation integral membrane protein YtvI n=1 Tax=Paenibacillus taiwanensis TaxID=401638 RepID=UPI00041DCFB8|nr:sporulation integral membrane protein YtvI [Paenibacillus taiwanensis]